MNLFMWTENLTEPSPWVAQATYRLSVPLWFVAQICSVSVSAKIVANRANFPNGPERGSVSRAPLRLRLGRAVIGRGDGLFCALWRRIPGQALRRVSRLGLALLLGIAGALPAIAQAGSDCIVTLSVPAADSSLTFPHSFAWTVSGPCQNAQLAFATSGNLPETAYVPDGFDNPRVISELEWVQIQDALDPAGVTGEFYWTVVDADELSFLELTSWRRFYAQPGIADTTDPSVTITIPTAGAAFSSTVSTIDIAGSASDNVGVTQVSWTNDRGGSGSAAGIANWSARVVLQSGLNNIVVTAQDAAGNSASASIAITFGPGDGSNPPPDASNGGSRTTPNLIINGIEPELTLATNSDALSLSGSASDDVGLDVITWSNDRGGSGTANGTSIWAIERISLERGVNRISIVAQDTAGNRFQQTLVVTYTPPDLQPPSINVTDPTTEPGYFTREPFVSVSGQASDDVDVTAIAWSNDRGGRGAAEGLGSWSVLRIPLELGKNLLTFTASDASGKATSQTLVVTYALPDRTGPTIQITVPTSDPVYVSSEPSLQLSGTASDDESDIVRVVWVGNRAGSGIANGTNLWTVERIRLFAGENLFTVIATDAAGNNSTASLTVMYQPSGPSTPPPDGNDPDRADPDSNSTPADDDTEAQQILLQSTEGPVARWIMDGTTIRSATIPFHAAAGWKIVGYADFNHDRQKDIVLQHHDRSIGFWFLNGTEIVRAGVFYQLPEGWRVSAVGDFNGDAQADLVLQNSDGLVAFWLMKDTEIIDTAVPYTLAANWSIRSTGDFNRDHRTDLVLESTDGTVAFWIMDGITITAALTPYSLPAGWHISGAGDFGAGGDTDLVLQNADGSVAFWLMEGTTVTAGVVAYTIPTEWEIVAPR